MPLDSVILFLPILVSEYFINVAREVWQSMRINDFKISFASHLSFLMSFQTGMISVFKYLQVLDPINRTAPPQQTFNSSKVFSVHTRAEA